jgi:hypothetical protein
MRQKKEFGKFCVLTKKETKQKEAREDKHEWLLFLCPQVFSPLHRSSNTRHEKKKKEIPHIHAQAHEKSLN